MQKITVPVLQVSDGYVLTSEPIEAIDGDLQAGVEVSYEITYQEAEPFNLTDNRLLISNFTDLNSKNTVIVTAYEGRLNLFDSEMIQVSL